MKLNNLINYIMQGFGFLNIEAFKKSAFGFVTLKTANVSAMIAIVNALFGFNHIFLTAYAVLIISEWLTGVMASFKRGEKHESRKLGRMILKIGVYCVPISILNTFSKHSSFPEVMEYELDPFLWLYWTVLLVIIWQLLVSLLENFESLGFKWAKVALKIINRKFYKNFDIDDRNSTT